MNSKRKWETATTVLTLGLCALGLVGISIVSYFQTVSPLTALNDTSIKFIGGWIAPFLGFIFQYGQNVSLYVKRHYATGRHLFTFLLWDVSDKGLCNIVFGLCATIDAGTNCLWLNNLPEVKTQKWYFQALEYSVMVSVVFVEEVLGTALQAFSHAYAELNRIMLAERGDLRQQNNQTGRENRPETRPIRPEFMNKFPLSASKPEKDDTPRPFFIGEAKKKPNHQQNHPKKFKIRH